MRWKIEKHSMGALFPLLLLMMFALFSLMLAATGSAVYRNGIDHLNENYTSRTAIAYVSEKIRQHDSAGSIFLTEVEDIPAIAFRDVIENDDFITYVYWWEGSLRELFMRSGSTPLAAMGNAIVELDSFEITALEGTSGDSPELLSVTASGPGGNPLSVLVHPGSSN